MQFGFVTKKLYDVIGVCFSLQNNEVPLQKRQQNLPADYLKSILIAMFRFHTLLILVIADLYCDQVLF